jgi:hypothetical protein
MTRTPERANPSDYNNINNNTYINIITTPSNSNTNYRPATSKIKSSDQVMDQLISQQQSSQGNKAKRSLTSCDLEMVGGKSSSSTGLVKSSRQLQLGKAKIDLDTQQSKRDIYKRNQLV